jgi:alanine-glyoxylate transaminase/serine-glyoxylate transaminase/serine-pyruvate transaminase
MDMAYNIDATDRLCADAFRKTVLEGCNLSLGSGLGKLADKVFRIGHLGECNSLTLIGALAGVEMGLAAAGVPHRAGGVAAALASLSGSNGAGVPG